MLNLFLIIFFYVCYYTVMEMIEEIFFQNLIFFSLNLVVYEVSIVVIC